LKGLRLDERMVRDGLAESRTRAQALIRAGQVLVDDTPHDKPGTRVRDESSVRVRAGLRRFASRGGEKLAGALDDLAIDVTGRDCLDVGASTGGFTDCLLQRGARSVVAVDVGYGQLDARLRSDARVHVRDRTNARHLEPDALPAPVSLVTADLSFISLRLVLPALARCAPAADWLLLVKPQFEVGPEQVGKGGVVRDDALRAQAADAVARAAAALGFAEVGRRDSQVAGPAGNREIFLLLAPASSRD
jgi:23S rRNA (cytidine1920-2'-O)/16S rRNA (cytidine1409-2'-O)-methyltransferase